MTDNTLPAVPGPGAPKNRWDLYLYEQRRMFAMNRMRRKSRPTRNAVIAALKIAAVAVIFLLFFRDAFADECMRRSGRLVCVGDCMAEVLMTCGAPDFSGRVRTDVTGERDVVHIGGAAFASASATAGAVERWVYVLGPGRYMRLLTFENGVLTRIETGGKP